MTKKIFSSLVIREKCYEISDIFFDLLTIAFLIGAYAIQYFTKKKLGMLRWVNYHNIQFQKSTVYGIVKYITVVVTIVLIVLIIAGYKKKKEMLGKIDLVMIMVMSVLGIVYLGITIFKSIETLAAYYFLMPLFGAATLMQIVRNGIAVGITKNEK